MKTYVEELAEIDVELGKGKPDKEGATMDSYRALLKRRNVVERIMQSLEVGPFKRPDPKAKSRESKPARPIHVVPVSMATYQDLFTAPPFGHLGVLLLLSLEGMKVGDSIHFQQFKEKILEGVIVGIEPPKKKSIRPDIENKYLGRYKVHWLPWDHTALWGLSHRVKKKASNGKKAPRHR